ncbi:MAG: FixH family protein [Alphaproteobacteria bacterium]
MSTVRSRVLTGRHVLAMVLGFFGVVVAVNGVFAWLALDTHPGLDDADAYRNGLAYNRTLDHAARQQALGWRIAIDVVGTTLTVSAAGADGRPLSGLAAEATLRRPVQANSDLAIVLLEVSAGRFAGVLDGVDEGQWIVDLVLHPATGEPFRLERRVQVGRQ